MSPKRGPEDEFHARMKAAHYEPLEPFPGRLSARVRALCQLCGRIVGVTATDYTRPRTTCAHTKTNLHHHRDEEHQA